MTTKSPRGTAAKPSGYIRLDDAAEYLDLSVRSVQRLISDGRVRAYRLRDSRTVRLRIEDLDAVMEEAS